MSYKDEIKNILIEMGIDGVDEEDFIKSEILNSFEILSLVSKMEEKWDIDISLEMIVPENLKNIECMARLVEEILGGKK